MIPYFRLSVNLSGSGHSNGAKARSVKDYIVENQALIGQHDYLRLSMQVSGIRPVMVFIPAELKSK